MARILNTLVARFILIVLAIHALLLPLLFNGLLYVINQSHEEWFINDVRKNSRFLADVFEIEAFTVDEAKVIQLLDSAVMGSEGVYAELMENDSRLLSTLVDDDAPGLYKEDFTFGEHEDKTYYLSIPLNVPDRDVILRLGYDEQSTLEQIAIARQKILVVLALYLILSIVAVVILSMRLIRPLKALQRASRDIATGQYGNQLKVDSKIVEISKLAEDLEYMRGELVGVNTHLRQEIAERQAAEEGRKAIEARLQHTQRLETVGTLAGGMAHEFNNILVPIVLYTDMAMEDLPPDSPTHKQLGRVLKSAKSAKELVQHILTFSRQVGHEKCKYVNIKPVVEEALELLQALILSSTELHQNIGADSCIVFVDPNQIHQLVMNLCSNACHAISENGGYLEVNLEPVVVTRQFSREHPRLRPGRYVKLTVRDTGHGIDPADINNIFEPFYTTREVGEGTGLGLSVAHGIIVSYGGGIYVESEPGTGTAFYVYIPEKTRDQAHIESALADS
jgi:signal transduction histidine kinase